MATKFFTIWLIPYLLKAFPRDLPQDNTVVAHKMGALNDKFHDVGIVFGSRPYIITIFIDDAWEAVSLQTLADISRMVYDYQESMKKVI